jgi:hypothetical protein
MVDRFHRTAVCEQAVGQLGGSRASRTYLYLAYAARVAGLAQAVWLLLLVLVLVLVLVLRLRLWLWLHQ